MNEPHRLRCDEVAARLWEYLDEELGPEQAKDVRAHLDACARCSPRADFERAFLRCLQRTAVELDVPEGVRSRIQELLERERQAAGPGAAGAGSDDA